MSCKSNDKDFTENTEWGSHFRKIILKYRTKGNLPAKEEILFPYIPFPYTRQWGGGGGGEGNVSCHVLCCFSINSASYVNVPAHMSVEWYRSVGVGWGG